jgi:outer membrane protein assembly factor BamB
MRRRFTPSIFSILGLMTLSACTNMVSCNGCNAPPAQWLAYRNNPGRYAWQLINSKMANASSVIAGLHVAWKSPGTGWTGPSMPGAFRASPIVFNSTVFIGDINGYFWALNASDGSYKWRYPSAGSGLNGSCTMGGNGSWGAYGIQSSATYASIGSTDAVIFGAPDPDPLIDHGNGAARLWALNASTGALIWKSDVVANIPTCGGGNIHERITYSSPLVSFGNVYVGVHDAADNPVQKGRLVAVDLNTGHLITTGFPFSVDGTLADLTCGGVCGGGIWDSPAYDGHGIVFTTGNVCDGNSFGSPPCEPEPSPDYSLSMVNVNPTTGALNWSFRAIPYARDSDPDWSAGPTSMLASCGQMTASVQKNGWTYAIDSGTGSCKWQFPPTAGASCVFPANTRTDLYGDDDYKQPGAAWGNYLFIQTGGWALTDPGGISKGYGRVHALDACQDDTNRVRWIFDVPPADFGGGYDIGAPTVTNGVVFVTASGGHVLAIADPATGVAPVGFRCSSVDFGPPSPTWVSDCLGAGFTIVPVPASIDVTLDDHGDAVGLRMEPAIALDKLFVATSQGHVYALQP